MQTKLTPGYVVYWTYPKSKIVHNTRAFQTKEGAENMADILRKDEMIVNYISYRE